MPYFVERTSLTVIVTAPGTPAPPGCSVIDGETVASCLEQLRHGMALSPEQAAALLEGDPSVFLNQVSPDVLEARHHRGVGAQPALPREGHWEYKVIPMTELFGFATAKGTASRMEEVLNQLSHEGWELVTTSERDSRWMSGETVLMTLRRYVVTEEGFRARFEAEERLRGEVRTRIDNSGESSRPFTSP